MCRWWMDDCAPLRSWTSYIGRLFAVHFTPMLLRTSWEGRWSILRTSFMTWPHLRQGGEGCVDISWWDRAIIGGIVNRACTTPRGIGWFVPRLG